MGVNAIILSKAMKGCHKLGIKQAETGPMLELNDKVQSQWKDFQTEQHKRRRQRAARIGTFEFFHEQSSLCFDWFCQYIT